jgi:hypothetical protein
VMKHALLMDKAVLVTYVCINIWRCKISIWWLLSTALVLSLLVAQGWKHVVWTSLGPLPRWVLGPTTRCAPGTTLLALHDTWWHEAQGLQRRSTRIGSCTCLALYRGLLDVLD